MIIIEHNLTHSKHLSFNLVHTQHAWNVFSCALKVILKKSLVGLCSFLLFELLTNTNHIIF